MVIPLAVKRLTTGEISTHLAEVYGAEASRQTIPTITDKVVEGVIECQNRPLDPGRFPVIVANPRREGFRCPGMRGTRLRRGSTSLLGAGSTGLVRCGGF